MKRLAASGLALMIGIGAAAAQSGAPGSSGAATSGTQLSQSECTSMWGKLDSSSSGQVSQSQAQSYVTDFRQADSNSDGRLSMAEFQSACQRGLVRSSSAATGTGSGTTGSSGSTSGSGSGSMSK